MRFMKQYSKLEMEESTFVQTMESFMIAFSDWSDKGLMPASFEKSMMETMKKMNLEWSIDDVFDNIDKMVKAFKTQILPAQSGYKYPKFVEVKLK